MILHKECFRFQTICIAACYPSRFPDCLTWNCPPSWGNLGCVQSVAQHDCPWQSGSGSIWVRTDNPLTPKEDWRISQALMSCELVFISHHKNKALYVTARALLYDHHVAESITGNCYCTVKTEGKKKKKGKGRGGRSDEDVLVSLLFISPQIPWFREMMW